MDFTLPTTKEEMYAVLGELFYHYKVKKDPYEEIELLDLELERQPFARKSQQELLLRAESDLRAEQLKSIKDYKADLDEQISSLSVKVNLLLVEKETQKSDIESRYENSLNKLEQTILKNGLGGSGVALAQIAQLENQKNSEIAKAESEISAKITEYQAQIVALQERKDGAEAYFSDIHQEQISKRVNQLVDEQDQLEREIFKYNNSIEEKEQKYKNTLLQVKANMQARYIEMKVVDYSKDQLIEMGYYADVVKCITHYYDMQDNIQAYEDFIESERQLMFYLEDFYADLLYMYRLRALVD